MADLAAVARAYAPAVSVLRHPHTSTDEQMRNSGCSTFASAGDCLYPSVFGYGGGDGGDGLTGRNVSATIDCIDEVERL